MNQTLNRLLIFWNLSAEEWGTMEQDQYQRLFRHSPVKRAGFEKLKGNLAFLQKKLNSQ